MTVAERHGFWSAGYLIVKGALSQDVCDAASRRLWSRFSRSNAERVGEYKEWNIIADDDVFLGIVDNPPVVDIIQELFIGPVRLLNSRMTLRFPGTGPGPWHTDGTTLPDGGNGYPSCIDPSSLLQLTAIYPLNDPVTADSGMTVVVPGSHRLPNSEVAHYEGEQDPLGAILPDMGRGDALIIHQSIWHRAGSVLCDVPREAILYSYGHRWEQPFDYDTYRPTDGRELTPRQRSLLDPVPKGAATGDYYRSK